MIKNDRDTLLYLLKRYGGQRPLARELGCDHKALKYWMDKHGITVEDYQDSDKELQEDKYEDKYEDEFEDIEYYKKRNGKYSYEKIGDIYIFQAPFGEFDIDEKTLDRILENYCQMGMTKRETALDVGLSIREVYVVLKAYGINHDSVPFREEVKEEKSVAELVDVALDRKEMLYYRLLEQKEYKRAIEENKKYKERDYIAKKHTDRIIENLGKIQYRPPRTHIKRDNNKTLKTLVVNISDWHKGKLVIGEEILGGNSYNKVVFEKRVDKYLNEAIKMIEMHKPEKILILNYGDGPDSPEANVYPGQRDNQDILYEEQVIGYVNDLTRFVLTIHDYHPDIHYAGVPGNHSKGDINWDVLANKMLECLLKDYKKITVDSRNIQYKIHNIYDFYLVQFHGNQMTPKIDTPVSRSQALGIIGLERLPARMTYLCQGHLHHLATEGPSYRRILLPSMVGGDDLSSNLMQTGARPAQVMFVFEKGQGLVDEHTVFFDVE